MIQTINIYNYPWIQGHINYIVHDLEEYGCKVRDIRLVCGGDDTVINQIVFECDQLITYNVSFSQRKTELKIYDANRNIIAIYNEFSF